jgi:hypothetical protein
MQHRWLHVPKKEKKKFSIKLVTYREGRLPYKESFISQAISKPITDQKPLRIGLYSNRYTWIFQLISADKQAMIIKQGSRNERCDRSIK